MHVEIRCDLRDPRWVLRHPWFAAGWEADTTVLQQQYGPRCQCKTICLTLAVWPTRLPSALTRRPNMPLTC
jgi:hypothetical protein